MSASHERPERTSQPEMSGRIRRDDRADIDQRLPNARGLDINQSAATDRERSATWLVCRLNDIIPVWKRLAQGLERPFRVRIGGVLREDSQDQLVDRRKRRRTDRLPVPLPQSGQDPLDREGRFW